MPFSAHTHAMLMHIPCICMWCCHEDFIPTMLAGMRSHLHDSSPRAIAWDLHYSQPFRYDKDFLKVLPVLSWMNGACIDLQSWCGADTKISCLSVGGRWVQRARTSAQTTACRRINGHTTFQSQGAQSTPHRCPCCRARSACPILAPSACCWLQEAM